MKKIILVSGTMGVGKTTTCQILKQQLPNSVFLDGDWCWDMHPFQVTDETKMMVLKNICFLLNNFIQCSRYENIIFCWIMHEQTIIDDILSQLDLGICKVFCISLTCQKDILTKRLQKDINDGIRTEDIIDKTVERLPLYENLNTRKIDVSYLTPNETVSKITEIIGC